MQNKQHSDKWVFLGLIAVVLFFVAVLFLPFVPILVFSIALAVSVYPVFNWLNIKIFKNRRWLSALATIVLSLVLIIGPLVAISFAVFHQSQDLYRLMASQGNSGIIEKLEIGIDKYLPAGITIGLEARITEFTSRITGGLASAFAATLTIFLSFILTLLATFYFLKDGAEWKNILITLSPLSHESMERIIEKLRRAIEGVIRGSLLICLIQGCLMGFGLLIFGVPTPALWGVLAALAAIVPTVGTSLVSIPAVIYLFATGNTTGAIGLAIWAAILVGTIDNLLSPFIVSKRVDIHPMLILFSVLGGIVLLGPLGALVGPLATTFLYTLISLYREEYAA